MTSNNRPLKLWWIPSLGLHHAPPEWQLFAALFVLALVVLTRRLRVEATA